MRVGYQLVHGLLCGVVTSDLELLNKFPTMRISSHSLCATAEFTLCGQPNLVEKLIVEDIAPTISITEGFPECITALKKVSFSPSLKKITHARKFANEQLCAAFPVVLCLFHHAKYTLCPKKLVHHTHGDNFVNS